MLCGVGCGIVLIYPELAAKFKMGGKMGGKISHPATFQRRIAILYMQDISISYPVIL